jgi:hypothetical protein
MDSTLPPVAEIRLTPADRRCLQAGVDLALGGFFPTLGDLAELLDIARHSVAPRLTRLRSLGLWRFSVDLKRGTQRAIGPDDRAFAEQLAAWLEAHATHERESLRLADEARDDDRTRRAAEHDAEAARHAAEHQKAADEIRARNLENMQRGAKPRVREPHYVYRGKPR